MRGTRRVNYLEENAKANEVTITPEDLARIDRAFPLDAASRTFYPEGGMRTLHG